MKRDYLQEIKLINERKIHPDEILPLKPSINEKQKIIAIGASTGGVEALVKIFSKLKENLPPILVVQHIPPSFCKSFIERLDKISKVNVKEAEDGEILKNSYAYLALDKHLAIQKVGSDFCIKLIDDKKVSGHKPSVDILMRSVCNTTNNALGIILTGMGDDGAIGMGELYLNGSYTIAQCKNSCIVYGMPKHVVDNGHAKEVLNIESIIEKINEWKN